MIEEDKQKAVQVELLKKENGKLISQLTAQESVIDGLKMERKIWGQELAQQGKIVFVLFCFAEKMMVFNVIPFKYKHSNIVVIVTGSLRAMLILSSCKNDEQKYIFCSMQAIIGTRTAVVGNSCKYS